VLDPERFQGVRCAARLYSLAELLAFRDVRSRHGVGLMHFPHYVRPWVRGAVVSVTVHDTIHLSHPPSIAARLYAEVMIRRALRGDVVLTGSAAARDDLAARFRVRAGRISLTPHGVIPGFAPPGEEAVRTFRRDRGLSDDFVLLLGSHRPHKNVQGGIEAWRRAGRPGPIVIPARDETAAALLAPLVPGGDARLVTGVTDEELPCLYAAGRIVLVPSLAEGFGLPPLEAAACGAPVAAYAIPPHREVLGDAAELVPAPDVDALAAAIDRLWTDDARRSELARRGPERARLFPWRRTAETTLAAWRAALDSRPEGTRA
jgi:alpha-1,3-rhamnosyl/mannosyltransferase